MSTMITEDQITAYFEKLATVNKLINHSPEHKAFFDIEDPDDLNNFDQALRSITGTTAMLLVSSDGELDDNNCENHVQVMDVEVLILQRKLVGVTIPSIRTNCINIVKDILGRTKVDARKNNIIPAKNITFRISGIPLRKVGPMNLDWYGYMSVLRFTCPFGYTVDSGTWTDI